MEEALNDLPCKDKRGMLNHSNSGTVSMAILGKLLRDGKERIWVFVNT